VAHKRNDVKEFQAVFLGARVSSGEPGATEKAVDEEKSGDIDYR